jgi:2',3'-cyclic-nucleotide 2'-phosphodiesterase (5'-nucleotidase family)
MKPYIALGITAAALVLFIGCSKGTAPAGKSGTVTIIYTGNIGAIIDPCGCRIPLGGMARRATAFAAMKTENPDAIIVDSGALLYDNIRLNPALDALQRMRARFVVEEVKNMGIDAVNISSMDLANSADSLLAYGTGGLPWLSANLVWKKTGAAVFPSDTVKTVGGVRVGIFGFMDTGTNGIPFFDETSPLKVADPTAAARAEVEKLKKRCDIVVALAYMNMPGVEKLVAEVPGIDVAIVSHTSSHNPGSDHVNFRPFKSGKTLIARCPDGGRVIGRLTLNILNGSTEFVDAESVKDIRPDEVKKKNPLKNTPSTYVNTFTDLNSKIRRDQRIQEQVDRIMKMWGDFGRSTKTK